MISLRIYVFARSKMLLLSHENWFENTRIRDVYSFDAADIATQFSSLISFPFKTMFFRRKMIAFFIGRVRTEYSFALKSTPSIGRAAEFLHLAHLVLPMKNAMRFD